jgi:hypothetical protein
VAEHDDGLTEPTLLPAGAERLSSLPGRLRGTIQPASLAISLTSSTNVVTLRRHLQQAAGSTDATLKTMGPESVRVKSRQEITNPTVMPHSPA